MKKKLFTFGSGTCWKVFPPFSSQSLGKKVALVHFLVPPGALQALVGDRQGASGCLLWLSVNSREPGR